MYEYNINIQLWNIEKTHNSHIPIYIIYCVCILLLFYITQFSLIHSSPWWILHEPPCPFHNTQRYKLWIFSIHDFYVLHGGLPRSQICQENATEISPTRMQAPKKLNNFLFSCFFCILNYRTWEGSHLTPTLGNQVALISMHWFMESLWSRLYCSKNWNSASFQSHKLQCFEGTGGTWFIFVDADGFFFFNTDVFWLMPLPLKSRVPRDPKHSQFSKKCRSSFGPNLGSSHSRPIHEQIFWHLRHCVSSNVAWTPRWDLRVLQLKNQNTGWLLTYKYLWVFPKIGVPENGWFIVENPIKMDD